MRSLSRDDGADGPKQNLEVEPEATIADVGDIEPQAIVEVDVGAATHLPESGEARLHLEPRRVPQTIGFRSERRRTRPDQRHVSLEHVQQLRQFVETELAENAPATSHA